MYYINSIEDEGDNLMTKLGINFVSASEGGLEFLIETPDGTIARRADTVEDGVFWVQRYGWTELYFTSSMDFATEEGFATDDGAKRMWKEILEFACEDA